MGVQLCHDPLLVPDLVEPDLPRVLDPLALALEGYVLPAEGTSTAAGAPSLLDHVLRNPRAVSSFVPQLSSSGQYLLRHSFQRRWHLPELHVALRPSAKVRGCAVHSLDRLPSGPLSHECSYSDVQPQLDPLFPPALEVRAPVGAQRSDQVGHMTALCGPAGPKGSRGSPASRPPAQTPRRVRNPAARCLQGGYTQALRQHGALS